MAQPVQPRPEAEYAGLDEPLAAQLPSFELFFKTLGFKRVHGRVWGLLVLSGVPLSGREVSRSLELSAGATSMALQELTDWGAIQSEFDSTRRCHLHSPVGNTLSIVATIFRRREQVVFARFKIASGSALEYVQGRYGEKDPRVFTLRSIISSCEIAEAVMQLVFSSVERALGDSESILARAVSTALKVGIQVPARLLAGAKNPRARAELAAAALQRLPDDPQADAAADDDEDDEEDQDQQAVEMAEASGEGVRIKGAGARDASAKPLGVQPQLAPGVTGAHRTAHRTAHKTAGTTAGTTAHTTAGTPASGAPRPAPHASGEARRG